MSLTRRKSRKIPSSRTQKRLMVIERFEHRQLLAADLLPPVSSELVAEGEFGAIAQFSHRFLDADLSPLESNEVEVGDRFYLQTFIQDSRDELSQGINSAYLDIAFDNAAAFEISVGEIQSLSFFTDELNTLATESSFTLQFNGQTTEPISLVDNGKIREDFEIADSISAGLRALPSIGNSGIYVGVDKIAKVNDQQNGIPRFTFEIRFRGALSGSDLSTLIMDSSGVAVNPGRQFEFEIFETLAGDETSAEAQTASLLYDGDYNFATRLGSVTEFKFEDVGASDNNIPVSNPDSAKLLLTIPLKATNPGLVNFTPQSGANPPFTDVISVIAVIPPSQIDFGAILTLEVLGPPTGMSLSNDTLDENQPAGTAIGNFTAIPDNGNEYTYALIEGDGDTDNALFSIDGASLTTATELDFEESSSRSILVETTDNRGFKFARAFDITIGDLNESPSDVALSNTTVLENQPAGTLVGELTAIDQDTADEHVFSVTGAPAATEAFSISGNQLITSRVLDFESQSEFNVLVKATDIAGLSIEKSFVVSVFDSNDAPTSIVLGEDSIAEELPPGSLVGAFQAVDEDIDDELVFSFVVGEGDSDNGRFRIEANELVTNERLDFESASNLSIRVKAEDLAGASIERTFEISVSDVEENDVNGDSFVSPIDALLVINFLNSSDNGTLDPEDNRGLDVNGDGLVTPIDALLVINHLNNNSGGEGEQFGPSAPDSLATAASLSLPEIEDFKREKSRLGFYFS